MTTAGTTMTVFREWLALPDGEIRRVVTVGDELLDPAQAFRRLPRELCPCCGRVAPYGRTCGDRACVESLWAPAG